MSYDIHITCRESWLDEDGPEIDLQHWKIIVASDPSLAEFIDFDEDDDPEGFEFLVEWSGHPHGDKYYFDYEDCGLTVRRADEPAIEKMKQIAVLLGAKVQGDDGEIYA